MQGINVKSEIGKLQKVILHRPGKELLNLTPDTLEDLLFDDIPFLRVAQAEHDAFADLLRGEGVEVVYLEDLMAEAIDAHPELREKFINQWISEANMNDTRFDGIVYELINSIKDTKEMVLKTMEGVKVSEIKGAGDIRLVDMVCERNPMLIDPMPNLYFTRDPFAMIGNGVSLNRMFSVTRNRETIYGQYIFDFHPDFAGLINKFYDRSAPYHIEGGDILNINAKTLAIGISQRTEADAIQDIAGNIFASNSEIETIVALNIPVSRAFMHLDTVFTQVDTNKFTYHPGIMGTLQVFILTAGENGEVNIEERSGELAEILTKYVGEEVELLPCGAGDSIAAAREQWNDGSNTLCVRPGVVVVYERNDVTNPYLEEHGIKVLTIPSAELSRGRGGPRCMSMPVWREDI